MKKMSTLKTLLSMTAAASMFLGAGCSKEENKEPVENICLTKSVPAPAEIRKMRIDKIYDTLRKMSCNMTYIPYVEKGVAKVGFGTPIEDPAVLNKMAVFDKHHTPKKMDLEAKKALIQNMKRVGATDFRTDASSIRTITKDYLEKAEDKAIRLIPNYLSLPVPVQTIVLQTELLTNGKLETYKKFCAAINAGRFADAANECGIKGLKHASFNQNRRDILRRHDTSLTARVLNTYERD